MDKTVKIDNKEVTFRATARTPRLYRMIIGRDMIVDMNKLSKAYKKVTDAQKSKEENNEARLEVTDLLIFEDIAFVMAKHANPELSAQTPDEWLDEFNMFSIYEVLPVILELWAINNKTTSTPKKK